MKTKYPTRQSPRAKKVSLGTSEKLFRETFCHIPVGISVLRLLDGKDDNSLQIVALNPAAEALIGMTEKQLAGKLLIDNHPGLLSLFAPWRIARTVRERKPVDLGEFAYSDERIPSAVFSAKAFPFGDNCVGVSFEDVTERKTAEERLLSTEARYRLFFEQDLTGDFIATPDGRMITCNLAFVRMFELESHQDALDRKCAGFFPDPLFWEYLISLVRERKTLESEEFEMLVGEGKRRILVRANVVGLFDDEGKLSEVRGSLFDVTERKKAEEQLRISTGRLRALSAHLQSVRELERTAIARELHDELGQVLTGLKMDLSWLDSKLTGAGAGNLRDKTRDMLKLVDSTIHLVRRITSELRPGILDDLGLVAALEWQAQEFQSRTGIACTFSSDREYMELSREFSTAMFRIFQESLTNVARHSGASTVNVRLSQNKSDVVLEVADNGKGISPSEAFGSDSFGLVGMQERAFLFGGDVSVQGKPGGGTTVVARFPLQSAV